VQRMLRPGKPDDWSMLTAEASVYAIALVSRSRSAVGPGGYLRTGPPPGAQFSEAEVPPPPEGDITWLDFASAATEVDAVGAEGVVSCLALDLDAVRVHLAIALYVRSEDRLADHIANFVRDRKLLAVEQLAVGRARLCVIFTKMRGTPHKALLAHVPGDVYKWALQVADTPSLQRGIDSHRPLALSSTFRLLHQASQALMGPGLDPDLQVWATKAANTVKALIQRAKAMPAPGEVRSVQLNQ